MITLNKLFVRGHTRYTRSPYVEDLTGFARWLIDHEYPRRYAQRLIFRTMRAVQASGVSPGSQWTHDGLDEAFRRVRQRRLYRNARWPFGLYLQSAGRLDPRPEDSPHASVLAQYRHFLAEVRGLAATTISQHVAAVRDLTQEALPKGQSLKHLKAEAIERHIEGRSRQLERGSLNSVVGNLRSFLRYCFDQRLIPARLDAIDRPVCFRDELPPRAVEWALIQKFLRSIKRTGRTGWRDFMALHLMAHYGLRPGEVTRLTVDSINWSKGTLLVDQFKTRSWIVLPLIEPTIDLLRRYLREGRRPSRRRELFLCALPPCRPMTKFSMSQMFKVRARQSGLPLAHVSAYALRHSFAMRLFARGTQIKTIGDLMGHNSIASTAIYLRLQTDVLREVALPVPTRLAVAGGAA